MAVSAVIQSAARSERGRTLNNVVIIHGSGWTQLDQIWHAGGREGGREGRGRGGEGSGRGGREGRGGEGRGGRTGEDRAGEGRGGQGRAGQGRGGEGTVHTFHKPEPL